MRNPDIEPRGARSRGARLAHPGEGCKLKQTHFARNSSVLTLPSLSLVNPNSRHPRESSEARMSGPASSGVKAKDERRSKGGHSYYGIRCGRWEFISSGSNRHPAFELSSDHHGVFTLQSFPKRREFTSIAKGVVTGHDLDLCFAS
jgi:hypothetical protein